MWSFILPHWSLNVLHSNTFEYALKKRSKFLLKQKSILELPLSNIKHYFFNMYILANRSQMANKPFVILLKHHWHKSNPSCSSCVCSILILFQMWEWFILFYWDWNLRLFRRWTVSRRLLMKHLSVWRVNFVNTTWCRALFWFWH